MRGPGGEGSFPTPGICSEQGQQHRGGGSSSLAAPDAAAARSIMSRRKQAKPQHLHSEDQDPAARDGELKECRFDGDGTVSAKRFKMEEAHVCERCSAEFFDLSQFIQHKKSCTKSPPILLMRDSPEALGTEGFTESSLSPFLNDTDSRSLNDFQSVSPQNPGELVKEEMSPTPITSDEGAYPKSDEGAYPKSDEGAYPKSDEGAYSKLDYPKSDEGAYSKLDYPKSDEGAYSKLDYPKSDEGAYSKLDYPKSDEGAYSKLDYPKSDERAYSKLDYPKSDERAYPKSTPPPAPTPPAPSYIPKAKVPNTNVTLQTIHATKVAVNQHTADTISASSVSLNAIPMILEQLVCLQQQQLQQIQLTEQIRIQIAMMAPHALNPSIAASSDPLKALGAHLSQQLAAAVALIGQKAGNQSLSLETLRQSKVPPPNMGLPSAGTRPTGHSASSFNPDAARLIQSGVSRFPHSVLPQSPRSVISQNPLSSMAAAVDSSRKGKPPNISVPENRSSTDESFFKHKCRFCGKVFGNDSALQIHLRSHTGERPFKCNICGNRFTTKGNLKVHFQRHKEKYPHIRMNPYPVPEHLDNVPTPNGIPYGMSVPLDESNVLADIKPVITTMPLGLNLSQTAPLITGVRDSINGALANHLQSRPSSGSEGGSSSGTTSHDSLGEQPNRNSSQLNGMYNGFNTNGQASETSKLQQLVENIDKSSRDPNECLICHRVLSCQSSLKMHYRIHTGERPYKCKLCGRAFSTKGNLKTHYGVHRANTPLKMQHSCPICHKKFTNAVVLQQHIRMHMGGQIPNTPLPEGVGESSNLEGESPNKKRELTNGTIDEPMENRTDPAESPEVQSPLPKLPTPKSENKSESSPTIFSSIAALEQQIKIVNSSLNLQRQNSMKSSEVGSPESDGMTNDSFSSLEIDLEFQNGRSPSASESTLFPAPSPSNSQHEKRTSKSPEFNRQDFKVGLPSTSRSSEDRSLNHPMDHPFGNLMDRPLGNLMDRPLGNLMDHSLRSPVDHNIEKRMENSMDHSMYPEGDGALDLTSTNFGRRAIKEEPGLYFSNEDYGSFLRVPPALVKTEAPSDRPFGDRPHSSMQLGSQPTPSPGSSPHMVSVRRSAKQHICNTCGKNFSSASALQIHERTHTGEKPFACTICGRAFTTKGNLKVHVGTHMWNNSARRGRRLSIDNPTPVLGNDARIPDLFPKDMVPPSMNLDPVMWNQYAAVLTSGLAMKTNEISVIQGGSIPALPVSLGGGSVVRGASVNVDGSQSGMSHNSMSRTGMGHTLSEMEKVGVENLQKRPFPRFMEEKNIAVS